ncbi:hypothetical protein [Paraburkholderia youngii]|uniref:hypothetical protein n=1 Tax=Paraburkholderia youngii TaxID=2782701 RepID=UPI003D1C3F4B
MTAVARWSYLHVTWIARGNPGRTNTHRRLSDLASLPLVSSEGGVYSTNGSAVSRELNVKATKETVPTIGTEAGCVFAKGLSGIPALSSRNHPSVAKCEARAFVGLAEAPDPLAAARARGRQFALDEYASPDNLTLLDAAAYAGRNALAINDERQRGDLYAVLPAGDAHGFRYPQWQFDAECERLRAVLAQFVAAGTNCWVIHSFMKRRRDTLDGRSPAEVILDATADIRKVVFLAARELAGEQGAS